MPSEARVIRELHRASIVDEGADEASMTIKDDFIDNDEGIGKIKAGRLKETYHQNMKHANNSYHKLNLPSRSVRSSF